MKIGTLHVKNNVCLAPMAGVSDFVFRMAVRQQGCGLCFTEMVSSNGLVRKTRRSYRYIETSPGDRPLGVQLFGADPAILSEATKIVTDEGADLIDINMGCPVKKVVKTGAGAALMKDTAKVAAILQMIRKATNLPLTIKIRSGWERSGLNAVDISTIAEDCGVDALILHPRTVEQGFSGLADWDLIAKVTERVGIPVIGSGDIRSPEEALRMLGTTGCDGVMVGRGALGNPWIVRGIMQSLAGKSITPVSLRERKDMIHRHLKMNIDYFGKAVGVKNFRKHLLWYTKGLKGGAVFRQRATAMKDQEALLDAVHEYFNSLGDLDYAPAGNISFESME